MYAHGAFSQRTAVVSCVSGIPGCRSAESMVSTGQVSNKKKRRDKGRIVNLPLNMKVNAKFVLENLLNVNILTILAGGLP